MSRRFQFSLRWLLAATTVVCLALGASLAIQRTEYIEVRQHGNIVRARGRVVRLLGPPELSFHFGYRQLDGPAGAWASAVKAERSWLAVYDVEADLSAPSQPGRYEFIVNPSWSRSPTARLSVK